jgi:hypothetical protein
MKHLKLKVEKLEERIAPGGCGGGHGSNKGSHNGSNKGSKHGSNKGSK